MTTILTRGQKMFNQRLLAHHCVKEDVAQRLWQELCGGGGDDDDEGAATNIDFEQGLKVCNSQLKLLGLEIVGVAAAEDDDCYYAIVNKFPDDVMKQAFAGDSPHQTALIRAILEHLVQQQQQPAKKSALLNLRLELEGETTMPLPVAEDVVEMLQAEMWITSKGNGFVLAPRAFAELSYLLTKEFGMEEDDLPQQIFFR